MYLLLQMWNTLYTLASIRSVKHFQDQCVGFPNLFLCPRDWVLSWILFFRKPILSPFLEMLSSVQFGTFQKLL